MALVSSFKLFFYFLEFFGCIGRNLLTNKKVVSSNPTTATLEKPKKLNLAKGTTSGIISNLVTGAIYEIKFYFKSESAFVQMGNLQPLFPFIFVFSTLLILYQYFFTMMGFKSWIFGVGGDCSTDLATANSLASFFII